MAAQVNAGLVQLLEGCLGRRAACSTVWPLAAWPQVCLVWLWIVVSCALFAPCAEMQGLQLAEPLAFASPPTPWGHPQDIFCPLYP